MRRRLGLLGMSALDIKPHSPHQSGMAVGGLMLLGVAAFAIGVLHQLSPTTPSTLPPTQQPSLQIAIATPAPEAPVASVAPAAPRHAAPQIPPLAAEPQQPTTGRAEAPVDAPAAAPDPPPPTEAAPQF
jgi:hypothetical protein